MVSTILTSSNFLKTTLLRRSNVIISRYSYGQYSRNLSTQENVVKGTRGILSKLEGYRKPIVYNAKVLKEIAKEVYTKESLGPPSGAQVSEAWEGLKSFQLQSLKNLSPREIVQIGIRSIEVAGFFAIGEIIGRGSIIGYKI